MTDSTLLAVLDDLERRSCLATVSFTDGEVYVLRFISSMHAAEGGDIVAEVVHTISVNVSNAIPVGAFINFYLADVVFIRLDGACVFERSDAA